MRAWILLVSGLVLVVGAPVAAAWAAMRPFDPDEFHWLLRLDLGIGLATAAGVALVVAAAVERAKRWHPAWTAGGFLVSPPRVDTDGAYVAASGVGLLAGGLVSGVLVAFHTAQHLFGFSL